MAEMSLDRCVIKYDNDIYPGTMVEVNETHAKVKCMHNVGRKRFFWPNRDNTLWYLFDDILRIIPQPTAVTGRHVEIDREILADIAAD